jgi:hypothetical protein
MATEAFDFESLTLDEVETIENLTGVAIERLAEDGAPKGKNLKSLIFVMMRRTNPAFTIEEAGKYTLSQATALFGEDEKKD